MVRACFALACELRPLGARSAGLLRELRGGLRVATGAV